MEEVQTPTADVPEELTAEQAKVLFFKELNTKKPGSPTLETIEVWKQSSGRVRMIQFAEDETYFYRPIKGNEYRGIVQQVLGVKEVPEQNRILKERVVAACVLWPKMDPTEMGALFAGTVDSLHTMIMQASNFLTEQEVAVMVREL